MAFNDQVLALRGKTVWVKLTTDEPNSHACGDVGKVGCDWFELTNFSIIGPSTVIIRNDHVVWIGERKANGNGG